MSGWTVWRRGGVRRLPRVRWPPMSRGPVLVRSSITGFVQRNPDALDAFGSSAAKTGGAWPSRRTWSMLAAVLPHLREDDNAAINTAVFGLIGEGAGVEFFSVAT